MTMQECYCFLCHYWKIDHNPYLSYGLLSAQIKIDACAFIDECRLSFIRRSQDQFRSEHFQGITDAVSSGTVDANTPGKKTILPSSFTGGRRYMQENHQDAIAICRVHGPPDLFTTFTCNPKWPEINAALLLEPGQKTTDRLDIAVRVYNMKLNEYLSDITEGRSFGPVRAGLSPILNLHIPFAFSLLSILL